MAYSIVPKVATGELWTAADFNQYFRDNFAAGVPDLIEAAGDLVAGTGANAAARLGVGTDGTILMADSAQAAGLVWGGVLNAAAKVTVGAITVNNGEFKTVDFTSEALDPRGMVDLATNAQRITIPAGLGGWYKIMFFVNFNDPNAHKWIRVRKNGADLYIRQIQPLSYWRAASFFTSLAAGDYLTLVLHHNRAFPITIARAELAVIGMQV
jgi:hypothetical protein